MLDETAMLHPVTCISTFAVNIYRMKHLEYAACTPIKLDSTGFNPAVQLPYGCTSAHITAAMIEFLEFLGYINLQLHAKGIARLETMLMSANFSSIVGEFVAAAIPRHCPTVVKNRYHNRHPDLLPKGQFANDRAQHGSDGIEIKASRYLSGWQGHNPEDVWLLVFIYDSNRPTDSDRGVEPKPFRFVRVLAAPLVTSDWRFAGRSETSRRTITASVIASGYQKLMANWVYDTNSV